MSRDVEVKMASLWAWLSLLNIVAGPIDWYYTNALQPKALPFRAGMMGKVYKLCIL